mmetsp:Transcript_23222/g.39702  ORF Transcript_23222/g.39702 Transcript_23222/m.39702 type:complete len:373 (-) Transcript_23222:243-1361(-)
MVVPSASKRSLRAKPRRSRKSAIAAAILVTVIAVSFAWLITSSLLKRTQTIRGAKNQPHAANTGAALDASHPGQGGQKTGKKDAMPLSGDNFVVKPHIMYGTAWKKDETADLVFEAVKAGFRFIDTACQPKHYDEPGVGYGWKLGADEMGLSREDFFLQTKFTSVQGQDRNNIPYDASLKLESQVRQSVFASLRNLKTDYIDSFLMHSPMETMDDTMRVWRVLEELVGDGKIKQLGISNCYDPAKFYRLHQQSKIKPKVLQNRFHKEKNFDVELRNICRKLGVEYQSFWTLTANRNALGSSKWKEIAEGKGLTPQTLMYAFMMTLGHTPLSGTKSDEHMKQDVDVMQRIQNGEKILNEEEMNQLSALLGIES